MATLETQESVGGISPIEDRRVHSRTLPAVIIRGLGLTVALVFIVLALAPSGATRIYQWPWSFLTSLLAAAPIVLLFLNRFGRQTSLGRDANLLFGLLAAVLVMSALVSRFASQSLDACLLALGMLATVFCIAAYVTSGNPSESPRCLQKWVGGFGIAFALVSLFGWFYGDLALHSLKAISVNSLAGEEIQTFNLFGVRNQSPLGHGNYTAGLALLFLPWLLGLAVSERSLKRLFWLAASVLVGFVLFTAGSRGALLGVVAIVASLLAILGIQRSVRRRTLVGLGLIAVAGVGIMAFSQPRVRSLIQDWNQTGELNPGDQQRWSMLEAGLRMGADHPIIGQGPGVTPLTYPGYRGHLNGGVDSALQLHSTPLQIWADLGTIGIVLSLGLGGIAVRRIWHFAQKRAPGSPTTGYPVTMVSAAVSTAGYLAFSLTDFQLDVPVFAGLLAINLGVIFGITRPKDVQDDKARARIHRVGNLRGFYALAALIITLPVLWATGHANLARRAHSAAVDRLERGDPEGFATGIRQAIRWAPHNAFYPASAGLGLLRLSYYGFSPEQIATLKQDAIGFFQDSLAISDDQEIGHFNLGWLLLPSNPVMAERHFRRAAALVPDKGGVYLGRGLACFEQGNRNGALAGFALEVVNDPVFATAPFWDIPDFESLRQPAIEEAISILENLAADPETSGQHIGKVSREVATILRDLEREGPPGALLLSRSKIALATAEIEDAQQAATINTQLVRRRLHRIPEEMVEAYMTLFDRTGPDPKAILADPAGREAPLMRQVRRERPGYGILMRNLDVPLPIDAYVVQENAVVRDFFPDLFPRKGYLPTTRLVRIVQEEGGTSG